MLSVGTNSFNKDLPLEAKNIRAQLDENFQTGSGLRPTRMFNVLLNKVFFQSNFFTGT